MKKYRTALKIIMKKDDEDVYYEQRPQYYKSYYFFVVTFAFSSGLGLFYKFPLCLIKIIKYFLDIITNSGMAFILHIIILLTFIIPIYFLEITMGQVNGDGILKLLQKMHPKLQGYGYFILVHCFFGSAYYSFLTSICLWYFYLSLKNFHQIEQQIQLSGSVATYILPCYFALWFIIFLCTFNGINRIAKISHFTLVFRISLLLFLIMYTLFLPGSSQGLSLFQNSHYQLVINPIAWAEASSELIYFAGIGCGIIPMLSSYRNQSENILKVSFAIPFLNFFVGILCVTIVFIMLGFQKTLNLEDGFQLLFVMLPKSFSLINAQKLSSLFYLTLTLFGMDTLFCSVEFMSASIEDATFGKLQIFGLPIHRITTRALVCFFSSLNAFLFCSSQGIFYYNLMENYFYPISLLIFLCFEINKFGRGFHFKKLLRNLERQEIQVLPDIFLFFLNKLVLIYLIILAMFTIWFIFAFGAIYEQIIGITVSLIPISLIFYYKHKHSNEATPLPKNLNQIEMELLQ